MTAKSRITIFEETIKQYENLDFLRDRYGRWTEGDIEEGWYQNSEGRLYHYDGVVWDVVPIQRTADLEYLG